MYLWFKNMFLFSVDFYFLNQGIIPDEDMRDEHSDSFSSIFLFRVLNNMNANKSLMAQNLPYKGFNKRISVLSVMRTACWKLMPSYKQSFPEDINFPSQFPCDFRKSVSVLHFGSLTLCLYSGLLASFFLLS